MPTIIAHSSRFHADDVFAVATLFLWYKKEGISFEDIEIIRTRDMKIIEKGDIVVDVGGVYDASIKRFDHHQKGGAGVHENDIPYASFGLVWKHFGGKLISDSAVLHSIEKKVVIPIDAMDNGVEIGQNIIEGVFPYTIQTIIASFGSSFKEKDRDIDTVFREVVLFVVRILEREITLATDYQEAISHVEEAYQKAEDKRLIVLEDNFPHESILSVHPEPLYVIYPNYHDKTWKIEAVHISTHTYALKKPLPEEWAGKHDEELAQITGVLDATFCHNGRFLAVARSKEGVEKLANLALLS